MTARKAILSLVLVCIIILSLTNALLNLINKSAKPRLLLIGLDGATWKVMTPLLKEGKLPNIKKLMDKGSWGVLESFDCPENSPRCLKSEVIWTTIATGKPPPEHGITDYLAKDPVTGEHIVVAANLRKTKAIWNILSEHKNKVGIIGYPVTWPAEEINGVIVTDRVNLHGTSDKRCFYPSFEILFEGKYLENFNRIEKSIFEGKEDNEFGLIDFMKMFEEKDNLNVNFAKHLLKKQRFDFFCLYLLGIDRASHYFWKFRFPEEFNDAHPGDIKESVDIKKYKDVINDYYVYCDNVIGELLKKLKKNYTVIIVSDHGFSAKTSNRYIFSRPELLFEACGFNKMQDNLVIGLSTKERNKIIQRFKINVEISGKFTVDEFNEIRGKAKSIIEGIKIKETGSSIFNVPNDTKSGFVMEIDEEYINSYPQHHLLIEGKEYKILDFLSKEMQSGDHDPLGIAIFSGKKISKKQQLRSASIYDITPTVLYLMGLPLARDMRGKVLVEAVDKKFLRKNSIEYIDTYETDQKETKPPKPTRSPEDEERIKETMRSLGYIN